ncbi:uncharacterized protein FTJAE_5029 [Fusarium tjaetaba]|uniref:Uncharacterized protein n=1 Tax=Fusarium tjaetaba TaxID=1567544 RepID=A0A8H5VYL4_9HYPO|nr:uncharacterized protein FTJAE_5029 [Fusarium tjaetaba]KAF5638958.1 hypothetical protein FTJAE_5029 [Fusarium tjaetaba]
MASPNVPFQGGYKRFFVYLREKDKRKRVQEFLSKLDIEPDLAQRHEASVTETDRSIPSDLPAMPEAAPPQQELTGILPCHCLIVEQNLSRLFERLTLGPDTDAQPAAKRRKLSHGGSPHRLYKGRRG